jgi:hypothetical protein
MKGMQVIFLKNSVKVKIWCESVANAGQSKTGAFKSFT